MAFAPVHYLSHVWQLQAQLQDPVPDGREVESRDLNQEGL